MKRLTFTFTIVADDDAIDRLAASDLYGDTLEGLTALESEHYLEEGEVSNVVVQDLV